MSDPDLGPSDEAVDIEPFQKAISDAVAKIKERADLAAEFYSPLSAAGQDRTERRRAAQLRKGELLHKLGEIMATEPVASAVLKHHAPFDDRRYCLGCDMGCSCEAASWPCSTVVLLLTAFGVDTTDIDLIRWAGEL